jgi:hypothetical protein
MNEPASIPLLELCFQQLQPVTGGGYSIDANGETKLFEGLIAFRADPGLAQGVHALFEAACLLHDEEASTEAAATILRALARARPQLPLREQALEAIQTASTRGLDHVERRAPRFGEASPEGTIKAHWFANPGRTRG